VKIDITRNDSSRNDTKLLGRYGVYRIISNQAEVVMSRRNISLFVLASSMVMLLAIPGSTWADGSPYRFDHYAGRPPYHAPYYLRYYPHYYPRYYPRYYPQYYPNYSCNNCGNNHHHNNHDHDNELWYGLLGGGVLGYTLGNIYPVPPP
jgi:hypothetical protein